MTFVRLGKAKRVALIRRIFFAKLAIGTEQLSVVENQDLQITFTNKGGKIRRVWLKKYKRFVEHPENRQEEYLPLYLMEDDKNRFGITIPTNTPTGSVSISK